MTLKTLTMVAALGFGLSGCAVLIPGKGTHRSAISVHKKDKCKKSQHWDGHKCRHKGKGHGARKHDD